MGAMQPGNALKNLPQQEVSTQPVEMQNWIVGFECYESASTFVVVFGPSLIAASRRAALPPVCSLCFTNGHLMKAPQSAHF